MKLFRAASFILVLGVALWMVGCADNTDDPILPSSSITVSDPAAAADWMVGTQHTIRWTRNNVDTVDVLLIIPNQNAVTIASRLATDSYNWTVSNNPSTGARIRVVAHSDANVFGTSGLFTITAQPPIVAGWDATQASVTPLGLDSLKYWFRLDSTYLLRERAGSTLIIEQGRYTTSGDSVRFHMTSRDNVPVDSNFVRWYDVSANNSTLQIHLMVEDDTTHYNITCTRMP